VWNASSIEFAVDGNFNSQITTNVPQAPGVLSLSHWSDGNPQYSGGPPTSKATLTVSRSWAFYNATRASLPCKTTNAPCTGSQVVGTSYRLSNSIGFPARPCFCLTRADLASINVFAFILAESHSHSHASHGNHFSFAFSMMS
jgi:hypothetical protein